MFVQCDVTSKKQVQAMVKSVVRRFKRRNLGGKSSEALGGATVTWEKTLDTVDEQTILRYRRMPIIM